MITPSERVLNISESKSVALSKRLEELKHQNKASDIIGLNVGEPDFKTPEEIVSATQKALAEGHTRYGHIQGMNILREELSKKLKEFNTRDK